jgi:hypothetical protein
MNWLLHITIGTGAAMLDPINASIGLIIGSFSKHLQLFTALLIGLGISGSLQLIINTGASGTIIGGNRSLESSLFQIASVGLYTTLSYGIKALLARNRRLEIERIKREQSEKAENVSPSQWAVPPDF